MAVAGTRATEDHDRGFVLVLRMAIRSVNMRSIVMRYTRGLFRRLMNKMNSEISEQRKG